MADDIPMTPPLSIGSLVEIIGPSASVSGEHCPNRCGQKFVIDQISSCGYGYSTFGLPWYPASSLRLVSKFPSYCDRFPELDCASLEECKKNPMINCIEYKGLKVGDYVEVQKDGCGKKKGFIFCIGYIKTEQYSYGPETFYSANKLPMWTKDELRKLTPSEIEEHLNPKLKIGDWVKVIGPCHPWYISREDDPDVFQIRRIGEDGSFQGSGGRPAYLTSSLRKLTPEEIQQHVKPKLELSPKAKDKIQKFVENSVLEAIYGKPSRNAERLSAIEKRLDAGAKVTRRLLDGQYAMQTSIDVLMGERPEVFELGTIASRSLFGPSPVVHTEAAVREFVVAIEERLAALEGKMPEVCENKPTIIISVKVPGHNEKRFVCDINSKYGCLHDCLAWAEKVLDSMREG